MFLKCFRSTFCSVLLTRVRWLLQSVERPGWNVGMLADGSTGLYRNNDVEDVADASAPSNPDRWPRATIELLATVYNDHNDPLQERGPQPFSFHRPQHCLRLHLSQQMRVAKVHAHKWIFAYSHSYSPALHKIDCVQWLWCTKWTRRINHQDMIVLGRPDWLLAKHDSWTVVISIYKYQYIDHKTE